MRTLGRLLQWLGLVLLPASMLLELTHALGPSFGVRDMLVMLVFGVCSFYLGRYFEGFGEQTRGDR